MDGLRNPCLSAVATCTSLLQERSMGRDVRIAPAKADGDAVARYLIATVLCVDAATLPS